MLPVSVFEEEFYKNKMKRAERMIGKRDRDDVYLLALAIKLNCPIWSNDKDFEGLRMKVYTTLDLIAGK